MDPRRFDSLARALAGPATRRGVLGGVAAVAAALIGGRAGAAQVVPATQAQCGNVACKNNPGRCAAGCVCCVYGNNNSRCRPPGTCAPGTTVCPPERPFLDPVRGCVACLGAGDCPAPAGACQVAACTAGVCGAAFASPQTVCRPAAGPCDLAESCTGSAPDCPADAGVPDGQAGACSSGSVCSGGACKTDLGGACASGGDCLSALCCGAGPRANLCGLADGATCGTDNDACCSGACIGGVCAPKRAAGAICEAGDDADCQDGLICCTGPGGFACSDPLTSEQHCGGCGTVCRHTSRCIDGTCSPETCFVAGTRVAMADGSSRPIELVAEGDRVLGRDGRINRVVGLDRPLLGGRLLYALNGSAPFVTAEHPFATEAGWKAIDPAATAAENPNLAVGRLQVGDRLLALAAVLVPALAGGGGGDEPIEVRLEPVPLRSLDGSTADPATQLYNLLLDGDHAYFADDLLVHNKA